MLPECWEVQKGYERFFLDFEVPIKRANLPAFSVCFEVVSTKSQNNGYLPLIRLRRQNFRQGSLRGDFPELRDVLPNYCFIAENISFSEEF